MRLEFCNHDTDDGGIVGCEEAEVAPLVEEVAVDIDAVGLGEVGGDERADGGEEGWLERGVVAGVDDF